MTELGLGQPEIAWHTARDRIAEVGCFLGLVTGTLGKIATDVKLLMQTEVGEVFEPYAKDRGSSSTMPQKRNPISCLYIHSTVALVRQHVAALLEAAGFRDVGILNYGFPTGYVLEAARNRVAARELRRTGDRSMAERTQASGRWLQPPDAAALALRLSAAPLRWLQRPAMRRDTGTGLVALADSAQRLLYP